MASFTRGDGLCVRIFTKINMPRLGFSLVGAHRRSSLTALRKRKSLSALGKLLESEEVKDGWCSTNSLRCTVRSSDGRLWLT